MCSTTITFMYTSLACTELLLLASDKIDQIMEMTVVLETLKITRPSVHLTKNVNTLEFSRAKTEVMMVSNEFMLNHSSIRCSISGVGSKEIDALGKSYRKHSS